MQHATEAQASAFVAHMAGKFHGIVIRKSSAVEMQWLAASMDVIRVVGGVDLPGGDDFLHRFSTTLGPLVYLADLSPDEKMSVMTHEAQHLIDFWNSPVDYSWLYLAEPEKRAWYEARGYRAAAEFEYARTKQMPSYDAFVSKMDHGYALGHDELQLGRELLEVAGTSISAGVVSTEAGREAILWLTAHAPELLAA